MKEISGDHEECSNEEKEVEVEKVNGKARKSSKDKENEKEGGKENGKDKSPSPTKSNAPSSAEKKDSPSKKIAHKINQEINETKIVKKEDIEDDEVRGKMNGKGKDKEGAEGEEREEVEEEGDEEEKEVEVSLRLNRSLAWYQAPLPPDKNSYTPVHILSRTMPAATTSSTASSTTSTEKDSSAVKDVLDNSIDCVRNEVLEVLTKTIYSVARSLRSDPVCLIRSNHMV